MPALDDLRLHATKRSIAKVLSKSPRDYGSLFAEVQEDIGVGRTIFSSALHEMIGAKHIRRFRKRVNGRKRFYELTEEGRRVWIR